MKQKAVGQTWMKSFEQNPHVKKMAGDFLVSVDDAIVCNKLPWVRIEAVECAELLLNVLSRVARKSILGLIIKPALDASALSKFAQDDLVGIPTQASKIELGDLRSHAEKVLQNTGLEYRKKVWSPCEYTIMGDVFTVWPVGYANPVRIEFNNGCVETITLLDSMLRRSTCKLASVFLVSRRFEEALDVRWSVLSKGVNSGVLSSPLFFSMLGPVGLEQDLNTCVIDSDIKPTSWDDQKIESLLKNGWEVWFVVNHHLDRVRNIQNRYPGVKIFEEELPSGFESKLFKLVVLTDRELWGTVKLSGGKPVKKKSIEGKYSELTLGEITPGDYVVHEDYGVALYTGLKDLTEKQSHNGEKKFLELRYAKKDKLLVPVSQSHRLTKYVGVKAQTPKLTRLGGGEWKRVKKKVSESVRKLAAELLRMYAVREVSKVKPLKSDVSLLHSLEQEFEFVETDDQIRSLSEIFHDLGSATPMDRLLVGDVGFGKTEVAIRTAFWVAVGGGQVALLAPTTILVEQHYHVFKTRMEKFGVRVRVLSRFLGKTQTEKVIEEIKKGKIDVVIGTHRLLSKDIEFSNLKYLIIDEEQRFGVKQKERFKGMRIDLHVLSMSATPIPRTLNMALSGVRDISIISTPPQGRVAIKNYVQRFDWPVVEKAILKEKSRGGQVYYVHNRVSTIEHIRQKLEERLPGVKFAVGHGQMPPGHLSKVMRDFNNCEYDVLICSTIIENGLDMPNVNTLIIDRAEMFGLSQLYQLRGRIGRSPRQAYAYFLYGGKGYAKVVLQAGRERKESGDVGDDTDGVLWDQARSRLDAIGHLNKLGSGFELAQRDLEIRGAGNFLGREQHGNVSSIGFSLYCRLLSEMIDIIKKQ